MAIPATLGYRTKLNGDLADAAGHAAVTDEPPAHLREAAEWWALIGAELVAVTEVGGAGNKTLSIERGAVGTPRLAHPDGAEVIQVATGVVLAAHGPRGEKGDTGDTGIRGQRGLPGDRGGTGDRGEKGDNGERGERGVTGEPGPQGDKGDRGGSGARGDRGERGDKGETGDRGERGPQGEARAPVRWRLDYNEATPYEQGDGVRGSDGLLYISTVAQNTGHDPAADGGQHWMAFTQAAGA